MNAYGSSEAGHFEAPPPSQQDFEGQFVSAVPASIPPQSSNAGYAGSPVQMPNQTFPMQYDNSTAYHNMSVTQPLPGQYEQQGYQPQSLTHPAFQPMSETTASPPTPVNTAWPVSSASFVADTAVPQIPSVSTLNGPHTSTTDIGQASQGGTSPAVTDTCLTDVLDFQFTLPDSETHQATPDQEAAALPECDEDGISQKLSDNESDGGKSHRSLSSHHSETPVDSAQEDAITALAQSKTSPERSFTGNSSVASPHSHNTDYATGGDLDRFTPSPASSSNRDSMVDQAIQKILAENQDKGSPSGNQSPGLDRGSLGRMHSPQVPALAESGQHTPQTLVSEGGQHSPQTSVSSIVSQEPVQDGRSSSVSSPAFSHQAPSPVNAPRVRTLVELASIAAGKTPPSETIDLSKESAVLPTAHPEDASLDSSESVTETMLSEGESNQGEINSGWLIVDGIRIPYVMHGGKPFVPVKTVEKQLLSSYPSKYPDELKGKPPLSSRFVSNSEAQQLTKMYSNSSDSLYEFNSKDLLVEYGEFNQFYSIIKKHFPSIKPKAAVASPTVASSDSMVYGGWLQINNTVIPYILRARQKYVPLQVLKFAAGLKTDSRVLETEPTQEECDHLNGSCKKAGLKFNFPLKETRLVSLLAVRQVCQQTNTKISMLELPRENPLAYARYNTNLNASMQQNTMRMAGSRAPRMPGMPNQMSPMRGMRGGMRATFGRGYGYPMQTGYHYPMPIRTINPRGSSRRDDSELAVLHHVQRVEFKGKIITCLVRASDKEKFALVEAVEKLYFPEWELSDFQSALYNGLRIPIYELTDEEEQAFISSYGLPIKHLNCKKAVQLRELDRFMPQLRYIFAGKKQMASNRNSPGKRQGGQMVGGSPFKRAAPMSYMPGSPRLPMRGGAMYRPVMRMPYPVGVAAASPPRRPTPRVPKRRPKYDGTVITIEDDDE